MMPKWELSDWCTAGFWLLVVLPVAFDLGLCPLFKVNTISYTTCHWCTDRPWLRWAALVIALGVCWHVVLGFWPFWGD